MMITLRNTVRALLGMPVFAAQHLIRLRYVTRSTATVTEPTWRPPRDAASTSGSDVQARRDGVGPVVVRRYSVEIAGASAPALLERLTALPNSFVPSHIAGFMVDGAPAADLALGDELLVEIPGPWNGPVRVDSLDASSMMLVTLDDHMEAGQIEFRAEPSGTDGAVFIITSWARAGDAAFAFAHLHLKVGAELQLAMWAHTCDRAVAVSGGTRVSAIRTATEILQGSDIEC